MNRRKNAVLVAVSVVLLVLAGYFGLVREDPDTQVPDDPARAATFICEHDLHTFGLTPKDIQRARRSGDVYVGTRVDRTLFVVRCPKCQQLTAKRAKRCARCGGWKLPDRPCHHCQPTASGSPGTLVHNP